MMAFFLILLAPHLSHAVVDGHEVFFPGSEEERIVTMNTVRLIHDDALEGVVKPHCTGIVISPREVLTAGHCAQGQTVYVEIANGRGPSRRIRALHAHMTGPDRDVGLLVFGEDLPRTQSLPLAYSGCDDRRRLQAGFGRTAREEMSSVVSISEYEELSTKDVDATTLEGEERWYVQKIASHKEHWMTLRQSRGSICAGDSGSPVFCRSKGRLAVAGISTAIRQERLMPRAGTYDWVTYCRQNALLIAARIDKVMTQIESWRNPVSKPITMGNLDTQSSR